MTESRVTPKYRQAERHYGSTTSSSSWMGIGTGGVDGQRGMVSHWVTNYCFRANSRPVRYTSRFTVLQKYRLRGHGWPDFSRVMQFCVRSRVFLFFSFFSLVKAIMAYIFVCGEFRAKVLGKEERPNTREAIFLLHYVFALYDNMQNAVIQRQMLYALLLRFITVSVYFACDFHSLSNLMF